MPIHKKKRRKGIVYEARLQIDGKRISRSFNRRIDAMQFEHNVKIDKRFAVAGEMTFAEASDEWLANHAEIRKAPSSVSTDKQMLRDNILPSFGTKLLKKIVPEAIESMIKKMKVSGLKDATINRNLELVRAIFNYYLKRQKVLYNPMVAVGLLKVQDPPIVFWTLAEADQFLRYIEEKYRESKSDLPLLYKFALNTGMRLGEILGLSWHEVDLHNRLITVRCSFDSYQGKIKETTKGRRIRHVPINSSIYDDLVVMKAQRKGDLVFSTITSKPKHRSNVTHYFQKACKEAGVRKIRFHDLRHSFASHWVMNNGELYVLKEILGHSDISTTQRYAHLSKSFLVEKADTVRFDTKEKVVHVRFRKDAVNE